MSVSREALIGALPITCDDLTLRLWTREDVDRRAEWPAYPGPYAVFTAPLRDLTPAERDAYFAKRESSETRITLAVDHREQPTIGYLVLFAIDWEAGRVGSMGVRIHPDWCDRGVGTVAMRCLAGWCARFGMRFLSLDVADPNRRAVRCYEKAGFRKERAFTAPDGVPFRIMTLHVDQYRVRKLADLVCVGTNRLLWGDHCTSRTGHSNHSASSVKSKARSSFAVGS